MSQWSRDLTTVSWQVHRICGFSISSSSGSRSDILVDTLAVLRSLYGRWWWLFVVEDPDDDVALDIGGAHDDATLDDDGDGAFAWWRSPWWWWSLFGPVDAYGDDNYDIWRMMDHDDDVRWWLVMAAMMYDGWWIMMMVMIVSRMIAWWCLWSYDMCGAYVPCSWWFLLGW